METRAELPFIGDQIVCLSHDQATRRAPARKRGLVDTAIVAANSFLGLPPVVIGLALYLLLSHAGALGFFGLLFTPIAMVAAQSILALCRT